MFEHSVLSSFDHPLLTWTHMVAKEDSSPSQKRLVHDYTSSSMTENTEDMSLLFWCFFVFFPIERINGEINHTFNCTVSPLETKTGGPWAISLTWERVFKYFQHNFTILLLSPFGEGHGPLNKFESPPTKNALCKVWLKLAQKF